VNKPYRDLTSCYFLKWRFNASSPVVSGFPTNQELLRPLYGAEITSFDRVDMLTYRAREPTMANRIPVLFTLVFVAVVSVSSQQAGPIQQPAQAQVIPLKSSLLLGNSLGEFGDCGKPLSYGVKSCAFNFPSLTHGPVVPIPG
jgi:hypothetical protein